MTGSSNFDELFSVDEVAALLKVRPRWVYDAARRGDIPAVRIGKYLRFRRRDVGAFIDRSLGHGTR